MSGTTARVGAYLIGGGSSGAYGPDEVMDIDDVNQNFELFDAAVGIRQATSAARPSTPFDGQPIYETDTTNTLIYSASAARWIPIGTPSAGSDAARDALYPTPVAGLRVNRTDKGWQEVYFPAATFTSSAASGSRTQPAGWYPVAGRLPLLRQRHTYTGLASANSWITQASFTEYERIEFAASTAGAFVVPVTGRYTISGNQGIGPSTDATNTFRLDAVLNNTTQGDTFSVASDEVNTSTSRAVRAEVSETVPLLKDDVVRFMFLTAATASEIEHPSYYSLRYVGPV
jgi:hypothetical protein